MNRNICDSVNHIRLPLKDHLPESACRGNKVTKGDRLEGLEHSRLACAIKPSLTKLKSHVRKQGFLQQ